MLTSPAAFHPGQQLAAWLAPGPLPPSAAASFLLGGVALDVLTDDLALISELESVFGRRRESVPPVARLSATVCSADEGGWGLLRLDAAADVVSPDDLLLGLASPDFPFERVEALAPWTAFALRGDPLPLFCLDGAECLFRQVPIWRAAVALLLFQRLMRSRKDALFFHAASVVLGGRGLMVVGPKGSGKSTTALALAARGHGLLGDEYAAYLPSSGELIPFRRPLGMKPGPRARGIQSALERCGRDPDREGAFRIEAEDLLGAPAPPPAPLRAVAFLDGFAPEPRLERIAPGREELARLQPAGSSLVSAAAARRVMQMARLLGSAAVFRLQPGDPDQTAARLEEALAS